MAKKSDNDSVTIAKKLGIFLLTFYVVYYLMSVIMVGAFGVPWTELGKYPFLTEMDVFNPAGAGGALGTWLAMVITYLSTLALAFIVIKQTKRTWDYVATTTLIHFVICCLVNLAFPTNWIWWVTLLLAAILVSLASEFVIYYLIEMRDIEMDH
uniref:Protein SYS1 homolog n=1 Tax=Chlamydomonas euryale TaxID=1486919 RepID=A0A6U2HSI1_9CHLO|mmetsp:Transcript_39410/g.117222  ORF Transcript_39410/g.117222 Transcript_39410/m.117222 type:complete len:154 (+) Transcript_39410:292-753(+)